MCQTKMQSALRIFIENSKHRVFNVRKYTSQAQSKFNNTVDDSDVKHHSKFSKDWWSINGKMYGLHSFNPVRVQFVRDGLANVGHKEVNFGMPLQGLKVLDVGCGGGIFSEPLARIGANVTGIDPSTKLIETAKEHAILDKSLSDRLNYLNTTIEEHIITHAGYYDVVVASEILEHVSNQDLFLKSCVDILKPGGSLFVTTLNRTFLSLAGAIIAAEYIFGTVPLGTHEWNKFISPTQTRNILEKYGCQTKLVHGLGFNPLTNRWFWTKSTAINYALHVKKNT
ncbi:hypothetical protein PV328_009500 [Microctonus aethiopoides]|uniref:Ubiquinone biosynthesis O-methyltransferase, mitochondrial n=1 Tax=Microctonus aethiopoides TaxID=144406 RepID=A0AA39F0U4_9HYME|nr:hypothetical protein PV328_009500 [Microctonus aethiopoides]